MSPTLLGGSAAAGVIHAGIRLAGFFRNGQRQLNAQRQKQVNAEGRPAGCSLRAAKENSPNSARNKQLEES
jgi:hypothetical protein